jgi:hypothetical protein
VKSKKANKTNSIICFLRESTAHQYPLDFMFYGQTVLFLVEILAERQNLCCAGIRGFQKIMEGNQMFSTLVALFQDCFMSLL